MRKFLDKLNAWLEEHCSGRYGFDELSFLLLRAAAVTFLLALLLRNTVADKGFLIATVILLVWALYRSLSRNTSERKQENLAYLRAKEEISYQISIRRKTADIRRSFRYFKCRSCKTKFRVPKGKGKVEITCPHCKRKIIRRT